MNRVRIMHEHRSGSTTLRMEDNGEKKGYYRVAIIREFNSYTDALNFLGDCERSLKGDGLVSINGH